MSSCLSGGGRTYAFDLEIVKSPSTSTRTSHTSSPSSTISESSNSGLTISTRKPRTPRKRPNQIYNEAAALLSTAYPNIFSTKHLENRRKFTKPNDSFSDQSEELLLPFRVIDDDSFLASPTNPTGKTQFPNRAQTNSSSMEFCNNDYQEDFDAESILDEEIEEGIDSIMGNLNLSMNAEAVDESSKGGGGQTQTSCSWYGNPMGLGFGGRFDLGLGPRRGGVRALRQVEEANWWNFPTVDVLQISPKFHKAPTLCPAAEKKKKKKKVEKASPETKTVMEPPKENPIQKPNSGLLLKLNYDNVLEAWSDKGSPFSDEAPGSDAPGNDVSARLAQIDLFPDAGAVREASVLRYKEKRRTRLFSKKIRYQVRKVNADRRPRMKGRFVRRPNSSMNAQR
ncbi:LOW QUALITY PROTEIN: protein CHLOROPLAST IMPORT APPARATUS 2 [Ziziphus jujuba]|uniref:LOW QUALITY PROTEIN: protein CHLOROPLAST IMPORT APPARATUS 2 n=1 Tax=Ziziphus jujuba TaxID=326968 RepID=A0ABM3IR19_ZIZJJ|nr:LOW QUALITY PROTEIN: protein CHLOROPLAST IMPORT APPARATUS 2 [Ziziphus jujuba]